MQIQLNSDKHIVGSPGMQEWLERVITHELRHCAEAITRVEVHLNDTNGAKSGEHDKRCMLEARLAGRQPVSVEHRAASVDLAVNGAAAQLARAVSTVLGKSQAAEKRAEPIKRLDQSSDAE